MKRIFGIILSCIMVFSSCENAFRDEISEIHKEIDELRVMLENANSNIEALQTIVTALENNDYVTGVTPLIENGKEIGYTINFSKSGPITIHQGEAPLMNVRKDTDGIWYWTLNGDWLIDGDGNKVRAEGVAPVLEIRNDRWYISYDDGETWIDLGNSKGDSWFKDVQVFEGEIVFVMADGTEFAVPRNARVQIHLDVTNDETGVLPGSEIVINYTLENATEKTFVTASSNGVYSVRVEESGRESGKIIIKAPYIYADGYINIMVSDGSSYSFIKVVNFYENKMEINHSMEYIVPATGGKIEVPFKANFDYEFKVEGDAASWLSVTDENATKADMKPGKITINVANNPEDSQRTGKISIIPSNSAGDVYDEIVINQESAQFHIEQSKFAVLHSGDTYTTRIKSTRGLTVKVPESAGWLKASVADLANDEQYNYTLSVEVRDNDTPEVRTALIELYSAEGDKLLGTVEFVQYGYNTDDVSKMVMIVRANVSNDFTASITLDRKATDFCNCIIDWGDGQGQNVSVSYSDYNAKVITHKYDVNEPTSFTVSITGEMPVFKSTSGVSCITEIVQWGRTGLQTVKINDDLLRKIANDSYGSFSDLEEIDFQKCVALESIPADLFEYCTAVTTFRATFDGCVSLKEIPEGLFRNCRSVTRFESTFAGCTGISEIPADLFSSCSKTTQFNSTFKNCSGITGIPEGLFRNCVNVTEFTNTFDSCTGLLEIPAGLFGECQNVTTFKETFKSCTSLKEIPNILFFNNENVTSFEGVFSYNTGILNIPGDLFSQCTNVTSFKSAFQNCSNLTAIPARLFDNNRKVADFSYTFSNCVKADGESPYTTIDGVKYHLYERAMNPDHFVKPKTYTGCFANCMNLDDKTAAEQYGW
jgi:hypothetical protein